MPNAFLAVSLAAARFSLGTTFFCLGFGFGFGLGLGLGFSSTLGSGFFSTFFSGGFTFGLSSFFRLITFARDGGTFSSSFRSISGKVIFGMAKPITRTKLKKPIRMIRKLF
ncbi:MAG TPA: hypothetical protein DIC30_05225 [Oceanospirillales bacterium]|nr:hypothetical protein [Oceanospirillales bacterium]